MKKLLLLALALAGCAAPDASDPVAFTRQAGSTFVGIPFRTGGLNSRLGTSVAGCTEYNGSFVFGAPGDKQVVFWKPDGGEDVFTSSVSGVGQFSLCGFGASGSPRATIAGGPTVFFADTSMMMVPPTTLAVTAMAQPDVSSGAALIASATDQSLYQKTAGTAPTQLWAATGVAIGHGLAFQPGNPDRFAATVTNPNEVKIFSLSGGVQLMWSRFLMLPPRAIAFGDFHPAFGPEIAVQQGQEVHVYSTDAIGTSPPVMVLTPSAGGSTGQFGAVLATEPNNAGAGLNALWIGSPGQDRVYRFLGDAGDEFNGPAASEFGWAMGFSRRTELIVGAPSYESGGGGVFRLTFDAGAFVSGTATAMECSVGSTCYVPLSSTTCYAGRCVGGVLCDVTNLFPLNCAFDGGFAFDAGMGPDAGPGFDAGMGFDAGPGFDAGNAFDGGRPDAGQDAGMRLDGGGTGTTNDAGRIDGDAGRIDAGLFVDAGSVGDAGALVDAGSRVDAGSLVDAGTVVDAGSLVDAGLDVSDAGNPDALPTTFAAGCTCQSGSLAPLMLFALAWLRRRRR